MKLQAVLEPRKHLRIDPLTIVFAVESLIILLLAIWSWTTAEIPAVLVTALTIAVLDFFPIYLDPAGELRLTTVIAIPTLVLFGWPSALLGAALGMTVSLLHQSPRDALVYSAERLASLVAAAAISTVPELLGLNSEVGAVVFAALGYTIVRTLVISSRMHTEEAIAWPRAFRFLMSGTLFHMGVFAAVATGTVLLVNKDPSMTSRLLGPMLAAGVTLQLYLPRILRGQEQRRVLAAVSVLAAAVDAKDPYTAGHSADVANLSRRVARILRIDEPHVQRIYLAGLLHDVGKMVVPPEILLKPGKLTADEWQVMRSHVEAGVHIVESIGGLAGVAPIVAASHEQLDGRGYPKGLTEKDIPLGSRINFVVDAYNALTTNRPYRAARTSEQALEELEKNSGTQFDPQVINAFRIALSQLRPRTIQPGEPAWWMLLRQPAFALLWTAQLISFVGDEIFFIALTLWVFQLTGSATLLATTLVVATIGQGLLGFIAGALADRLDRRALMVTSDIARAALVAILPLIILKSIPASFLLLAILNVGTVFFRTAVYALIPSVVPADELQTGNALLLTTERIAEIIGGVLGSALVLAFGYHTVFLLDAASFAFSGACIAIMPLAWRAGLGTGHTKNIPSEIGDGLRYLWRTPLHRVLALAIIPGYLTLGFTALRAPMIIRTAGLPIMAYGVINSAIGVGKLVSAVSFTAMGRRWTSVPFVFFMYVLTAVSIALFGSTSAYPALIVSAFFFGLSNIATNIVNATISMANTPSWILGRLMASRQVLIAATTIIGTLVFGRLADIAGPAEAIVLLGVVSGFGTICVWVLAGSKLARLAPRESAGE
jgi:putative nucleotidyltransferase with HDIG domain